MNEDKLLNDIFIALLAVLFIRIYDAFFYSFEFLLEIKAVTIFFSIWGLMMLLGFIILVKPSVINLKDKEIIHLLGKTLAISLVIYFILFITFFLIGACNHGDFPGIEACRANIT